MSEAYINAPLWQHQLCLTADTHIAKLYTVNGCAQKLFTGCVLTCEYISLKERGIDVLGWWSSRYV